MPTVYATLQARSVLIREHLGYSSRADRADSVPMRTQNKKILEHLRTPEGARRIGAVLSSWARGEPPARPKGSRITQARKEWLDEQRRRDLWR
jgi:hypothetical protein